MQLVVGERFNEFEIIRASGSVTIVQSFLIFVLDPLYDQATTRRDIVDRNISFNIGVYVHNGGSVELVRF
jgi:hypothetical protein